MSEDPIDDYVSNYMKPLEYIEAQEMCFHAAEIGMPASEFQAIFAPLVSEDALVLTTKRLLQLGSTEDA